MNIAQMLESAGLGGRMLGVLRSGTAARHCAKTEFSIGAVGARYETTPVGGRD